MKDLSDWHNADGHIDHVQEVSAQPSTNSASSNFQAKGSGLRCPDCDSSVLLQDKFCDCCRCDLTKETPILRSNVLSSPTEIAVPLQKPESTALDEESPCDIASSGGTAQEDEKPMTDEMKNAPQDIEQDDVLEMGNDQSASQEVSIESTDFVASEEDLFSDFGTVQQDALEELKGPIIPSSLAWEVVVEADSSLCKDPESFADFPKDLPKKIFVLEKPVSVVGRAHTKSAEQPDVVVREDKCVSRSHLKLFIYPDGGLFVLDETSSNGSMLNGVVLDHGARTELKEGDVLTIGNWTKLVVRKSPVFQ